jgi:AraC-like DNA-binding protein
MAWMRILLAAEMLDEPGRTVASIADACGYASDTALRTTLNMQLGKTPKVLRREGALAAASGAFLRELRAAASSKEMSPTPRVQARA